MPGNPPGFTPPRWPRLGANRAAAVAIGGLAPAPVDIPICWFTQPVRLRMDRPYTTAQAGQSGGASAYEENTAAITAYGGEFPFEVELVTACDQDARNLAHWTMTYRSTPRMRAPELVLDLMIRTNAERIRLRRIERFQRIRLTGVPPEFPEGAAHLILSGITKEVGTMVQRLRFTTQSVVGSAPGVAGPWFRLGSSNIGGTDVIPY